MYPYLALLRPLNCLMSALAVLIGGFLILKGTGYAALYQVVLAMVSVFLITGAGNAINDYRDVDSDRVNRPHRPIPSGRIGKKTALVYTIILFAAGVIVSVLINWLTVIIAVVNTALLVLYSFALQDKIFAGNAVVAYLVGSTFLYGGAAALQTNISLLAISLPLLLMLLAGLSNFSREIVKDLDDLEGDKQGFLKRIKNKIKKKVFERFHIGSGGVVMGYSENTAVGVASIALIAAILISPLPYLLNMLGYSYLMVLVPTNIAFLIGLYKLLRRSGIKRFRKSEKVIKLGMFLGLVSFIVGILV